MLEQAHCWNGQAVGRYRPEVVRDGSQQQINNPEVEVDARQPHSAIVAQQALQLKLITARLSNAYNGLDVDWIDTSKWR